MLKNLLIEKYMLFKIDDNYYFPKEFEDFLLDTEQEEFNENKANIIIDYYIMINGIIKMDRLISLVKKSGFEITKDDIIKIVNEKDSTYIIRDDVVYYNDFAIFLDENELFELEIDDADRKIVDFNEALAKIMGITTFVYSSDVFETLKKLKLSEDKLISLIQSVFGYIMSGSDDEEIFENIFEARDIELKSKEKEELYEMIWDISFQTPSWNLGGYSREDICVFEEEEEIKFYIIGYILINGVIKVDKLLEILREYHDIDITKKELINIIKYDIEEINATAFKDYICYSKISSKELNLVLSLKLIEDYKIIEDLQELLNGEDDFYDKLDILCNKYGLTESSKRELFFALRLGIISKDFINNILTNNCNLLIPVMIDALYKDLLTLMNNTRMWILNGYTPSELGREGIEYVKIIMSKNMQK